MPLIPKHFHHPRSKPRPAPPSPRPVQDYAAWSLWACRFRTLHTKGTLRYVLSCVWLFPLMLARFIAVSRGPELHSFSRLSNIPQRTARFVRRAAVHVGRPHAFWLPRANTWCRALFGGCCRFSSIVTQEWIAGSHDSSKLSRSEEPPDWFPRRLHRATCPHVLANVPMSSSTLIFCCFDSNQPRGWEVPSPPALICIS